ncbi:UNVERIFIED_CONTAM: hypothetical protein RMT77_008445 [Armadillidium vulgare]
MEGTLGNWSFAFHNHCVVLVAKGVPSSSTNFVWMLETPNLVVVVPPSFQPPLCNPLLSSIFTPAFNLPLFKASVCFHLRGVR